MAMNFGVGTEETVKVTGGAEEQKTELGGGTDTTTETKEEVVDETKEVKKEETTETEKPSEEFAIAPGTTIELDGNTYTVDDNGNIIDSEGNIFKEAKDVKEWKDSLEETSDENENIIDINSIQSAIGIDIVDDKGNAIEFENTPEGINNYVKQVIDNSKEQNYKDALDMLYAKYPVIADVLDYYIANGNSLEGFTEVPDRSNITIDKDNVEQQEQIIREAWKEQGRKGDVNSYIDFLKSNDSLFSVAEEELNALKESDKELAATRAREAKEAEEAQAKELQEYWNSVNNIIKSKKLGSYQLPDTITRSIDGKKIGGSLDDFFNYIYRVDKEGKSQYVHDLEAESMETRMNDEILRAYIKYTGGNYESLVNMKVNEKEVNRLKLQSKTHTTSKAKFIPPKQKESKELDFGL